MSGNSRTVPSTIWATLALGLSPIGSIPFVDTDGVSITTDILHFFYTASGQQVFGITAAYQLTVWGGIRQGYIDKAQSGLGVLVTIDAPSGRFKLPIGQAAIQINSTYVTANSVVHITPENFDATFTQWRVTIGDGNFLLTGNAACTSAMNIRFTVSNPITTGP